MCTIKLQPKVFLKFLFYYLLYANGQVRIHVLLEFSMNLKKIHTTTVCWQLFVNDPLVIISGFTERHSNSLLCCSFLWICVRRFWIHCMSYPWIGLIKFAKTNTDAGQQFPYVWLKHSIFVNSYYFLLYFVIYTRNKESKIVWAFEEFQLYLASSGYSFVWKSWP